MKKILVLIALITLFSVGYLLALPKYSQTGWVCTSHPGLTQAPGIVEQWSEVDGKIKIRCVGSERICWSIAGVWLIINTDLPPGIIETEQFVIEPYSN